MIDKETNEEVPLVELVTPSTIEDYKVESGHGLRTISFSSLDDINGFRVTATDCITGEYYSAEFDRDNYMETKHAELMPGIKLRTMFLSQTELSTTMPEKGWPMGFWLLHFHIKVGSHWRIITNANNEVIVDGLLKSDEQFASTPEEVFQVFEEHAGDADVEKLFFHLHDALMVRYGEECWQHVKWIKIFWHKICSRHFRKSEDLSLWAHLLQRSTEWPDEAIAEGHVPTSSLSGTLLKMYCFERSALDVKPNKSSLLSCIKFFPHMEEIKELFQNKQIDLSVLFGFKNALQVQTGAAPSQFVISKYKDALVGMAGDGRELLDDDWLPSSGSFLSPLHYRYAVRSLIKRYTCSLSVESKRRGRMLGMIAQMNGCKLSSYVSSQSYEHLVDYIDIGLFTEQLDEENLDDESAVQQEHLQKIIHFLSLLAQVCRAEVHRGGEGALQNFCQDIMKRCNLSCNYMQNHLGYLIFMGEDLFAFYLMLWELVFTADIDAIKRRVEACNTPAVPPGRKVYVRK